jgi:hypothetical protein
MRCTTQSIVKPAARTPRLMPATVRPAIDASSVRLHTKIASKNAERVHLAQCPSPALNGRVTADINSLTICEIAGLSESFTEAVRPLREGNSRPILKFHRPKRVRPKPLRPAGVFMRIASTLPPSSASAATIAQGLNVGGQPTIALCNGQDTAAAPSSVEIRQDQETPPNAVAQMSGSGAGASFFSTTPRGLRRLD